MNHFDDEAPLSKIGLTALILMMLGEWNVIFSFGEAAISLYRTHHVTFAEFGWLIFGGLCIWGGVKIACSKIAYKNREE